MARIEKNTVGVFLKRIFCSKWFYLCLGLAAVNILTAKWLAEKYDVGAMRYVVPAQLLIEGALAIAYYFAKKKNWSTEKIFLLMVIPLGILFIMLLPCGQTPDEAAHYMRTYGITDGHLIVPQSETNNGGSELPAALSEVFYPETERGLYGEIIKDLSFGTDGEVRDYNYATAALYSPITYLPQTLAIGFGRLIHAPLVVGVYLGRIFDFAIFVFLMYFAIKFVPKFKDFILFIGLFPMTLQEATSLSPDSLTISLSIFMIAFVCYLAYEKKGRMSKGELGILYTMAIFIGFCKIVYLPLLLLYFLIPAERFGGVKQKRFHALLLGGIVLVLNVGWLLVSSRYLVDVRAGVNPGEQARYILTHPHMYLASLLGTISARIDYWSGSMFGMSLGHYTIDLPQFYFCLYLVIFLFFLAQSSERYVIKKSDKMILISVLAIIFLLIVTSLYLQWTPVGDYFIDGVQGRYFLPIILLLPFMLCPTKKTREQRSFQLIKQELIVCSGVFCNVAALTCIFVANL